MISGLFKNTFRELKYLFKRETDYYRINPQDALFFLTYRCTSQCKTCSMWQRQKSQEELSLADWQRIVDMCYAQGVKYIELFGGDALLRKDVLVPLIAHIKTYPIEADLVTNCNLMDRAMAEGIVGAGLDDIWLSIDGVEKTHDYVRGKEGSYDKVVACLESVRQARGMGKRPFMHCNTTVSNLNVGTLDKILDFAEEKGLDFMHLEYAGEFTSQIVNYTEIDNIKPNPYFVSQGNSILANPTQARSLKEEIQQLKKKARNLKINLMTENVDCLNFDNMVSGQFGNRRCYITHFKVTVDPYGNVLGCPFFGNYHLGNLKDGELSQIWKGKKHIHFIRSFGKIQSVFCKYCVLGVQRNRTFWQLLENKTHHFLEKAQGKA